MDLVIVVFEVALFAAVVVWAAQVDRRDRRESARRVAAFNAAVDHADEAWDRADESWSRVERAWASSDVDR